MPKLTRRQFGELAISLGVSLFFARARASRSRLPWSQRRDLYAEGVAPGDPDSESVILWTRREFAASPLARRLTVEVAEDPDFHRVVATGSTPVMEETDWTCRTLIAGLKPATVYWYRFADQEGAGSRVGRTTTAPSSADSRAIRFAVVSCQNANMGAQTAYRRMIFEDERAMPADHLEFVLHLGDFIYELMWYPEDRPQGMYDRRIREVVRYPHGEKIADFYVPTTVDDYRRAYRAYLRDPDLQDARARWPFVCIWDNHEFSWQGWQSLQKFDGQTRPAQTRKVAANQAWFEYQPARLRKTGGKALERFEAPPVIDAPVYHFDRNGMGQEPNNLAAINSLTGYRTLRWGRNVELIVTDQRSYRSEDPSGRAEAARFKTPDFPDLIPQEILEIIDAGNAYDGGRPPEGLLFDRLTTPNFRKDQPPQTILGARQKAWFLDRLRASNAPWKVWANTIGTLDARVDPQNLPDDLARPWPGTGYASLGAGDFGDAYTERAQIYDFVRDQKISGFVTVAGDRHSFWAGLAAKSLPPRAFEPVGVAFITASISAPGLIEALEHGLAKDHPLRALYLAEDPLTGKISAAVNMLLRHGVRACIEYQRSGAIERAKQLSNADLAPHLSFVDMAAHGYTTVKVDGKTLETEFVCIPRPLERSLSLDGSALRYRVMHRTTLWSAGETPRLEQHVVEGDPMFSL